ncbi:hypothetical protein AWZ03_008700 [Drosophila navojoa]|uniref:Uncharacterized protein n=1 Tax=Drosophila navojoa TaxID=7232 RepID=A0A484B9C6_DRONA|nr:hypothetical protein AWZ03_008700 [Drosophila navojoa]
MPTITEDCIDGFQQYYSRPPEMPKKKSIKQMIYDDEENSYFGRTIESWACTMEVPQQQQQQQQQLVGKIQHFS